jgi:siderophore-iron reductase FhuF
MLPMLSPYLTGEFAEYGQGVGLTSTKLTSSLQTQMDNGELVNAIIQFAQKQHLTKPKSQASVWHMYYTLRILPSIVVAHSALQQPLPLALKQVRWDPIQQQLQIPHQGVTQFGTQTEVRYHSLLFEHLSPLHDWLNHHFSISHNVLWSNSISRIQKFLTAIEHALGTNPNLQQDRKTLLHTNYFDGRINPLYKKSILFPGEQTTYRLRNHCCLLHEVPHKTYCGDCPKHTKHVAFYSANRK